MTVMDIERNREKFSVGDRVIIPESMVAVFGNERSDRAAEVVGVYKHVFNVRYSSGYQQSISYIDAGSVRKLNK